MDVPGGAVSDRDAGKGNPAALREEDHARTGNVSLLVRTIDVLEVVPPVVISEVGLPIDRASAIDAHIMDTNAGNEGAVGADALPFPAASGKRSVPVCPMPGVLVRVPGI